MLTTARMQLLAWVLQVPVKITSMQGTHIFRRDWTTQLIKCTPWSTRLHPHPIIIKKMKTFLEVEGKMGPIPVPISQFRPPLPNTNPNIRKNDATEKRKRATPKKVGPATPKPTTACLPLPEAPPKPKNDAPLPPIPAPESTLWPGTGKMLGNLFEDRNWLLPPNYLDNTKENKTENELKLQPMSQAPSLRLKKKNLRQVNNSQKNVVLDQVGPFANLKNRRKRKARHSHKSYHLKQSSKPQDQKH